MNGELFYTLKEAQIMTDRWRTHYNTVCPHSSLGASDPLPKRSSFHRPQMLDDLFGGVPFSGMPHGFPPAGRA